jgi:hypothetical protein
MEQAMQFENEIMKRLVNIIAAENIGSVLAVCEGEFPYAKATECAVKTANNGNAVFDRVLIDDSSGLGKTGEYDWIILCDWFQRNSFDETAAILNSLIARVNRQLLFVTSCPPEGTLYHPAAFSGWDFSFEQCETPSGLYYLFSFFKPKEYDTLPIDFAAKQTGNHGIVKPKKQLKLAYILPHHNLTGGMKALLSQMKALNAAGHTVTVYYQGEVSRAFPQWSGFADGNVSGQVIIPPGKRILDYIKPETDLIMLGWFRQAVDFVDSPFPVALWEQGSEFMFGDLGRLLTSAEPERKALHICYRLPVHLLAVSPILQTVLKGVYGRESQFFPNIIDTEFYHPAESKTNNPLVILMVGYSFLRFKGFGWAIEVLRQLTRECEVPFRVCWASQRDFTPPNDLPFELTKYIALPQESLAELYRKCDVFFSSSLYESFTLPPIEAMSSGTAVAAADCGGIHVYADDKNCLLIPQGDVKTAVQSLKNLLEDNDLRERFAKAGRETALRFTAERIVGVLEEKLYRILG